MKLTRKSLQRLARRAERRNFRQTFAAAVKCAQARLAHERTWAGVDRIIRDLHSIISKESTR